MDIKNPWLIQRGILTAEHIDKQNIPKVSEFIDFEYIRSIKFEFEVLLKSIQKVYDNRFEYTAITTTIDNEKYIIVYHKEINSDEYIDVLKKIKNHDILCKESVFSKYKTSITNFWWDLTNDIFFSTSEDVVFILDSICSSIKFLNK